MSVGPHLSMPNYSKHIENLKNWAEILVGMPCPEYIPTLSAKKTLGQLALKVVSKSKLVFKAAAHSGSASHAS